MAQQATPAQDGTMLHTAQIIHSVIERLDNMDSRRTQQETEVRACRSHRELILDLAKRTTTCSGADPASFRRWINRYRTSVLIFIELFCFIRGGCQNSHWSTS